MKMAITAYENLNRIVLDFVRLPKETEWVEFKQNYDDPVLIGEYISALSNSAKISLKQKGYMIWGVSDDTHEIIGTKFNPFTKKKGNEEIKNWLLQRLSPRIHFDFYQLNIYDKHVVVLEIDAASHQPVQFSGEKYIRIGSYKKKLKEYPEEERKLWRLFDHSRYEEEICLKGITSDEVLKLLKYPIYFDILNLPLPDTKQGILDALLHDGMIQESHQNTWNILNLGAILFAKNLMDFQNLKRKVVRVILYKDDTRIETIREQVFSEGYACSFKELIGFITSLLPTNEVIGQALRKQVPMFPELAVRELVANVLIHQDFQLSGTSPMIEIFSTRMEITNSGLPLVQTDRFLDSPPKSRNESIAAFMRRIGVCEERGSGIDKVVFQTELYQLPAPLFETTDEHTRVVLFAHRELKDMDKEDRVRACYLHACLKYVQRDYMTNTTLRDRFGIEPKNSAMASRIIKDALRANMIRCYDDSVGAKAKKYLPFWA